MAVVRLLGKGMGASEEGERSEWSMVGPGPTNYVCPCVSVRRLGGAVSPAYGPLWPPWSAGFGGGLDEKFIHPTYTWLAYLAYLAAAYPPGRLADQPQLNARW